MDERARIQSMLNALPPFQQEQVKNQVSTYRATVVAQRLSEDKIAIAVYEFWKTMVTYLYNSAGGRSLLGRGGPFPPPTQPVFTSSYFKPPIAGTHTRPPPPPPSKPHPLAVPRSSFQPIAKATPAQGIQFVDKSGGLLAHVLNGMAMPVGLQDWVNRVYIAASEKNVPTSFCDVYVGDIVRSVLSEVWKVNWVGIPTPTLAEITRSSSKSASTPIDLDAKAPKKVRPNPPAPQAEFIPFEKQMKALPKKRMTIGKSSTNQVELNKRAERAHKFKDHLIDAAIDIDSVPEPIVNVVYEFGNDEEDVFEKTGEYAVVGTCHTMEKRYFRLTSAPDPTLVRPEPVLRKWMAELEKIWSNRTRDWKYVEDQMRAIRQDLTVQNLRGELTCRVYELNARWALECGDLGQFNQCQTQLKQLHDKQSSLNTCEFISYRLLYYYFQNLRVDEQIFLKYIFENPEICQHPNVQFALRVRAAATTNCFSQYFQLAKCQSPEAASHTHFLIRAFEDRQRIFALGVLTKAFITQIRIDWLTKILGFSKMDECTKFLLSHGAIMKNDEAIDPKASHLVFAESPLLMSSKLKLMG